MLMFKCLILRSLNSQQGYNLNKREHGDRLYVFFCFLNIYFEYMLMIFVLSSIYAVGFSHNYCVIALEYRQVSVWAH